MPGCLCGVVGMFPTLHVNSPSLALTAYSCQVVTFALPQGNFLMPEDFCAKWFLITWPRTFPFCNSMAPCSYPPGKLGMFQALFRIRYHCAAPPRDLLCAHSIIDLMLIPFCIKASSVVCALSWCVPPMVCTHIRAHTHTHTPSPVLRVFPHRLSGVGVITLDMYDPVPPNLVSVGLPVQALCL